MKFEILDEDVFRSFLDKNPLATFIQTPEMAKVRAAFLYKPYYVGVKKDGKVVAATMMGSRKTHFGFYEFYAPRGLLVDYEDLELLNFFTISLKKFIKDRHGYVLRIDPYYITCEKDIDGNNIAGGINHQKGIDNLLEVGFVKANDIYQDFKLMFALNLNKSKEEIFKDFKSLPKRMIKRAKGNSIVIREACYDELNILKELIEQTSVRKNFKCRNLDYYQNLYKNFHPLGQVKFMLAELDLGEYQDNKMMIIGELKEKLKLCSDKSKLKEIEEKLKKEEEYLADSYNMVVNDSGKVILSAGVFVLYKGEMIYLFGGNRASYMNLGSSYLLQWTMIEEALDKGFSKYNFYGISKASLDDGVYKFKRGFNGYVEELIGDYLLPINLYYYLNKFLHSLLH